MRSMVVLLTLCAVAYGSLVPAVEHIATPLLAHSPIVKYIGGSAVTHQSRVDVESSPAVVSHSIATPLVSAYSGWATPAIAAHGLGLSSYGLGLGYSGHGLGYSADGYGLGLSGHGHYLKKRSLGLAALPLSSHSSVSAYDVSINHGTPVAIAHAAPIAIAHAAPIALAHAAPIVSAHGFGFGHSAYGLGLGHGIWKRSAGLLATPLISHSIASPIVKYIGGSAVSHQSRVDVQSSPAVVAHSVVAPVVSHSVVAAPVVAAHSAWATPAIAAHGLGLSAHGFGLGHGLGYASHGLGYAGLGLSGHGHFLKKRSAPLAIAYSLPAVSKQSRIDVISRHSAPIAIAHAAPIAVAHAAPIAVAHAAPIAVAHSAHLAPIAHSAVWTAPSHYAHSGLLAYDDC